MKPWYKRSVVRVAFIVFILQMIYYSEDKIPPISKGFVYPEATTRSQKARSQRKVQIQEYRYSGGGTCGVGDIIKDFSKYRERQLKRGYTEKQIDDQLRKEVRKLLDQRRISRSDYNDILDQGLDPEYDLNELDEGLFDEID